MTVPERPPDRLLDPSSDLLPRGGGVGDKCGWVVSVPSPPPCFMVSVARTADGSLATSIIKKSRGESEGVSSMAKEGNVIEVLRDHIASSINTQIIIQNVDLRPLHYPVLR